MKNPILLIPFVFILQFFISFIFGFVLTLSASVLLLAFFWLCLTIIPLIKKIPVKWPVQHAVCVILCLVLCVAGLAALYGIGHTLYGYMGAWPINASHTRNWLVGSKDGVYGLLLGLVIGCCGLGVMNDFPPVARLVEFSQPLARRKPAARHRSFRRR